MGEELSSYVEEKYHHMVVSENDFLKIKEDIQAKMHELEEKYKRCKPFRITFFETSDRFGYVCPYITVRPDTDTDKIVLHLASHHVRNAIFGYRRP
jgi:hypothetical protein